MPTQTRSESRAAPGQKAAKRQKQVLGDILKAVETASKDKNCTYTCGGTLKQTKPINIAFKQLTESHWSGASVVLPGMFTLCEATKFVGVLIWVLEAEFELGFAALQVLDQTYRKALALSPANFMTDFSLSEHDVLGPISKLACSGATSLTATLYKLNIYGPGDFFRSAATCPAGLAALLRLPYASLRTLLLGSNMDNSMQSAADLSHVACRAHIDTPRSHNMMGSLVICLPSAHTGGQLVVQHGKSRVKYNFGSQLEQDGSCVQWVFFYSDVQHEILEVKTGHRVTLTYNLYATPAEVSPLRSVSLITGGFGKALSEALDAAQFLPDGGALGFSCHFLYPHTGQGFDSVMLKGIDALIMATAKQLHLEVELQPVWKPDYDDCWAREGEGCERAKCAKAAGTMPSSYAVGGKMALSICEGEAYMDGGCEPLEMLPKDCNAKPSASFLWVQRQDFHFQLGLCQLGWGNEPQLNTMYSAAAIIVKIPPGHERFR
ncbi:hypothetical protein MMC07_002612 [Pseudocyphellaria aurata]|nr:hypothetical protein [Pseudocyphellaria aurata]